MRTINKIKRLFKEYLKSFIRQRFIFMHITPTRKCNLMCKYCYQYDNTTYEMSLNEFKDNINNNYRLGLGIVSFTGGEPLVWKYLNEAIEYCTMKNIFTQLTTNGSLLTTERVKQFKISGLDYLMVSMDAIKEKNYTKKTISNNPNILNILKYAQSEGIVVSWNTVLTLDNYEDVYKLIEISKSAKIPISIGVIVSPPNRKDKWDANNLELGADQNNNLLHGIIEHLIYYKNKKYPIIEPEIYFKSIISYLRGENVWDCSLAKKYTLQVTPKSEIYWCSKLNSISPYKANSINEAEINKFKKELATIIKSCNQTCYSNCAYNAYYLQKNKMYLLLNILPLFVNSMINRKKGNNPSKLQDIEEKVLQESY